MYLLNKCKPSLKSDLINELVLKVGVITGEWRSAYSSG